jgi:hypothetical protein
MNTPANDNERRAARALLAICDALLDAVKVAGSHGAPSGILYAATMRHLTLQQYQTVMGALEEAGKVTKRGQCYFAV